MGPEYPLVLEKLSPILAYYVVNDAEEGIKRREQMVEFGGMGHTAVIHTSDNNLIKAFADRLMAGRIIERAGHPRAIGDIYNTNVPSLTLGCGSYGGTLQPPMSVPSTLSIQKGGQKAGQHAVVQDT